MHSSNSIYVASLLSKVTKKQSAKVSAIYSYSKLQRLDLVRSVYYEQANPSHYSTNSHKSVFVNNDMNYYLLTLTIVKIIILTNPIIKTIS